METNKLLLGCVADDFTGAGDIASFLTRGGLRTILISGIPADGDIPKDADAVVISLKSRTAPVREAVRDTLESIRSLETSGCERFYINIVLPLIPRLTVISVRCWMQCWNT